MAVNVRPSPVSPRLPSMAPATCTFTGGTHPLFSFRPFASVCVFNRTGRAPPQSVRAASRPAVTGRTHHVSTRQTVHRPEDGARHGLRKYRAREPSASSIDTIDAAGRTLMKTLHHFAALLRPRAPP